MVSLTLAALALWQKPLIPPTAHVQRSATEDAAPGQLTIVDQAGKAGILCPLKGTKVEAEITGMGARVTVVQTFTNPTSTPIEAIYTFPLPENAAVDRMRMQVGPRIIEGEVKRREEARAVYEAAKAAGQVASLLDQERPNIFTQSVANIMPKAQIRVEISYVQLLKFEDGLFEFSYPMVVGPRFIPASTPDPGKVTPPTLNPGVRSGATIDMTLRIDAGAPIKDINSVLHQVNAQRTGEGTFTVSLSKKDEIPNKDFILRWGVSTATIQDALLTHWDEKRGGTFTLILMPPKVAQPAQVKPKEVVFVIDQSGSQNGFPIEKSKELTLKLLEHMNPNDTFNVIGFANQPNLLWQASQPVNARTLSEAEAFVKNLKANGGTQLLHAVKASLGLAPDPQRLRVVVFNTDGFVGNDFEILDEIQKTIGFARMFTFGIGNGVNRFLIDAMSAEGKGDSEIVTLAESADPAVERFIRRTQAPLLTGITADVQDCEVLDVFPRAIPDVFSQKPVVIMGRYAKPGNGRILVRGTLGAEQWEKEIELNLTNRGTSGSAIESLWARAKVDDLMRSNWREVAKDPTVGQRNTEKIIDVALQYGLMTQYTSFVAVEKKVVNVGGKPRTVAVPIEMTDGVNLRGESNTRLGRSVNYASGGGGGRGGPGGSSGVAVPPSSNAQGAPATKGKSLEKKADARLTLGEEADAAQKLPPAELRKRHYETKVDKELRDSKSANVAVQVRLKELTPAVLARLKKLGLKVEDSDQGLKMVFGTIAPKKLLELAQDGAVLLVQPLP